MTEPGGPAWRQTTFFPFSITSRLAQGRAVRVPVSSATFTSEKLGEVEALNAVATIDDEGVSLFVVNHSTTVPTAPPHGAGAPRGASGGVGPAAISLRVDLAAPVRSLGREVTVVESRLLHDDDLYAANTLDDRERVGVAEAEASVDGDVLSISLPAVSWAAVRLA